MLVFSRWSEKTSHFFDRSCSTLRSMDDRWSNRVRGSIRQMQVMGFRVVRWVTDLAIYSNLSFCLSFWFKFQKVLGIFSQVFVIVRETCDFTLRKGASVTFFQETSPKFYSPFLEATITRWKCIQAGKHGRTSKLKLGCTSTGNDRNNNLLQVWENLLPLKRNIFNITETK